MKLGLINREAIRNISPLLEAELDSLMATIGATFLREHTWDGKHGDINIDSITQNNNTDQNTTPSASKIGNIAREKSGHWWLQGPWLFDDPNSDVASIRPPIQAVGTYDNYAPAGIDNAVILELEGAGATTFTGLRHSVGGVKRMLLIRNRDSSATITLKHSNSGSSPQYRFDLPGSVDVEIGPKQNMWLYYDPDRDGGRWTAAITKQQSGGLASTSIVLEATITLSESQLENLNTTPVTVVAAQGAETIIIPLYFLIELTVTTGYGASPTFSLRHPGASSITGSANPSWSTTGTKTCTAFGVATNYSTAGGGLDPRNLALEIIASADNVGAGVATARVIVVYHVASGLA